MRVLVTGAPGFIGSHTCLELLARGHEVVLVGTLSISAPKGRLALAAVQPGWLRLRLA